MSLGSVIDNIRKIDVKNIKFNFHAKDRIQIRNLNEETIKHYLLHEEVVGVHDQSNNVYKLWFKFNDKQDLTVVIRIKKEFLKVITVIKESSKKRLKNEKKK